MATLASPSAATARFDSDAKRGRSCVEARTGSALASCVITVVGCDARTRTPTASSFAATPTGGSEAVDLLIGRRRANRYGSRWRFAFRAKQKAPAWAASAVL